MTRIIFTLLSWLLCSLMAHAHEVNPSIMDVTAQNGRIVISLSLNAESFVAGIDLDGLNDTEEAADAHDYDRLRGLPPQELETALRAYWPGFAQKIDIRLNGQSVGLTLGEVAVDPVGNTDLPRRSRIAADAPFDPPDGVVKVSWAREFGDLIVRQEGVEAPYTGYLRSGAISEGFSFTSGQGTTAWQSFAQYIPVGFEHILPLGLDHILFVLGLFFFSPRLRPLISQITMFTVAHSVTLALGAFQIVTVSAALVEPIIAASIVYVAVENIVQPRRPRWRPVVIFCFGLLHGLGFASVLGQYGLPEGHFLPALLGFNIGVEFGQITVVLLAALVSYALITLFGRADRVRAWRHLSMILSALIACIGAYWVIERVFL